MSDRYLHPRIETMPRSDLATLQEERLLRLLPVAYERSGLVRETWDAAGVHPRDIRSVQDFVERAPFVDKDAIRSYRDRHGDPYGGTLIADEPDLTAILSSSGTTGDPTLVPQRWEPRERAPMTRELWEVGVRPGDPVVFALFTFRGPIYMAAHVLGGYPVLVDHHPSEMPRLLRLSREYRPRALYSFSVPLMNALAAVAEPDEIRDAFSSYAGVVYGGEALSPRAQALAHEWGLTLFQHTNVGDVGQATECREHDGCHFWEDGALVEHLEPDGREPAAEGERGELVVTALADPVAPLIRYRSDDLVTLTRQPCACGRTHGRLWPHGRKGDEVVIRGRSLLPADLTPALEQIPETAMGLFQIIRPSRRPDQLRLRVGHEGSAPADLADRVAAAVAAAVGVTPDVELVPNETLLRLGPPHKIPRVTRT